MDPPRMGKQNPLSCRLFLHFPEGRHTRRNAQIEFPERNNTRVNRELLQIDKSYSISSCVRGVMPRSVERADSRYQIKTQQPRITAARQMPSHTP